MRVWEHEARRWRLNQVRKLCDNAYARGVAESAFTCRTDSSRLAIEHLRWPVLVTSPLGFALAASGPAWANEYGRIRGTVALARVMAALSALSLAPDLDVIAFRFGIAYGAPFGHRGAAHSICAALALASIAALARRLTPEQVEGGKTRTRL